uniref:Reverse transcriptase Ty1/copia-type domain-containing protein n=1 Tax=Cannabis sativa TaxID=3483 RepID=A0A803QS79_CANSA
MLDGQKIEPETYEEAIKGKDAKKWNNDINEEMHSLTKNKTKIIIPILKGKSIVSCKWLFRHKEGRSKGETVRLMLALANQFHMEIDQMDVTTSFLHGELEEDIYIEQPKGFVEKGK